MTDQFHDKTIPQMHTIIDKLTDEQKAQLLKSIPNVELLKLIEKENLKFD